MLKCEHPDIDKNPVVIEIFTENDRLRNITLSNHEWNAVTINPKELEDQEILTFRVKQNLESQTERNIIRRQGSGGGRCNF